MLNKKSALPHSENSDHLNMETTLDGKTVLQFAEECPICTEKYYEKAVINSCKHAFCFSCVLMWAEQENSCPLCKNKFTILKKMVRMQGEDANPKEVQATIKRIAHKKQRPPEMTLAEFEQFQFDIEMNELDEWIIDDEVYSAATDVAPVDHLEVLEQSLAEMTRHSHRERRHRNNNQTAHRKTKRRKPRSPVVREDIGPVRNRYYRHHHNNNNNNSDCEETPLIDLASESNTESSEPKYNLRRNRTTKEMPADFMELANDDVEEKEQKDEETMSTAKIVNTDSCHVDRRSIVPTTIVKASELNLPVNSVANEPGDHDNNDGLSEEEVVEEEGTCIEYPFIPDMDINFIQDGEPQKVHEEQTNYINDKEPQKVHEGQINSTVPQFTLTDIPFTDDDTEKVMSIEGATDLQSVNNVSINNEVSPTDPKPTATSASVQPNSDSTLSLKPPSRPQPPVSSAKKTPMLAKLFPEMEEVQKSTSKSSVPAKSTKVTKRRSKSLTPVEPSPAQKSHQTKPTNPTPVPRPPVTAKLADNPATAPKPLSTPVTDAATTLKPPPKPRLPTPSGSKKAPSTKTKIIELGVTPSSEPLLSSTKAQILNKLNPSQPVSGSDVPASEESNGEPKIAESSTSQVNGTARKRNALAGRKGKEKKTALSAKITATRAQQTPPASTEKKTPTVAANAKLMVSESSQTAIQNNGIDAQRLNKMSFKKKTTAPVVQPAIDPVPQTAEQTVDSASNDIKDNTIVEATPVPTAEAPIVEATPDTMTDNNAADSTVNDTEVVTDQSAVSTVSPANTSENIVENRPLASTSSETELAAPATVASVTNEISTVYEKIAPVMCLNIEGYKQHGSFAHDEVDFNDNELMTHNAPQQQHVDSNDRDMHQGYYNEQNHHAHDDRRGYNDDRSYQSNYNDRQFKQKYNERRSNYSTATDNNGYNQRREGSRDGQYHNGNNNSRFVGRYDNEVRPANYYTNRRGSCRHHHNGSRYGYNDRSNYHYPRQQYDTRDQYNSQYEVPTFMNGPPLQPPLAMHQPLPLHVQPMQVLPQQVVQQVVSVQQVPTVPVPVLVAKTVPAEEPKADDDYFRRDRNKRKQKTPEPDTSTVAHVEPKPIVVQTRVAVKTEVAEVPIKTEPPLLLPIHPAPPQPRALTPPPPFLPPSTVVQEPNVTVQSQPQMIVAPQSEVVVSRKRSRSRSPCDDIAHKRYKVAHNIIETRRMELADKNRQRNESEDEDHHSAKERLDNRHQEKLYEDEEKFDSRYLDKHSYKENHVDKDKHDRHKDKYRGRSSDKDKDKQRSKDKEKDKRRDKEKDKYKDKHKSRHEDKHRDKDSENRRSDKDKHRSKDKDKYKNEDKYNKKSEERPRSAPQEDEQLIECANDPKPVEPTVVIVERIKKALKSSIVGSPDAKKAKKRRLVSKVSMPQ